MAMTIFPSSPKNGDTVTINNGIYTYESSNDRWVVSSGATSYSLTSGDSDKLDGKHASDFVERAGSSLSGDLSFANLMGISWSANTDGASLKFSSSGDGNTGTRADSNLVLTLLDNGDEGFKIETKSGSTTSELFYVNNSELSYKNNKIWHAGNDGTGSGLDADAVDGHHASDLVTRESQTKDDITTRTQSGAWQTSSATVGEGWPQTSNAWYHLLSATHSNVTNYYSMQFAGNFYNSNDIYYRSTNGYGLTGWNKMWHSGNDGSGSGLDADTLDGKHASEFMLKGDLAGAIWANSTPGNATATYSGAPVGTILVVHDRYSYVVNTGNGGSYTETDAYKYLYVKTGGGNAWELFYHYQAE